jgi:hypothetical protein
VISPDAATPGGGQKEQPPLSEDLDLSDWPNWPIQERELREGEPRILRFFKANVPWED